MAWNRPQSNTQAKDSLRRAGTTLPTVAVRGLICATVVIIAAAVAAWLLWPQNESLGDKPQVQSERKIKEVSPASVENIKAESVATNLPLNVKRDHSELTREELLSKVPHWAYTVEDRKRIDPGYEKRHDRFVRIKESNPWNTPVDKHLAALVFAGADPRSIPSFSQSFKDAFLKSLETPTIVLEKDSEELKEKKRTLNETKIRLKDQIDAGGDIVQILNDECNRLKKIKGLRDTLTRELNRIRRESANDQEVEDYVKAANIMLSNAGATKGVRFPIVTNAEKLEIESKLKK